MGLVRWQVILLFLVGVTGIVFEIWFSPEVRPLLLVTDFILIGLLPVDIVLERYKRNGVKQ